MKKYNIKNDWPSSVVYDDEKIIWAYENKISMFQKLLHKVFKKLNTKAQYCLTDKRIIINRSSGIISQNLDEIKVMTLSRIDKTYGSLYFGDENSDIGFINISDYVNVYSLITTQKKKQREEGLEKNGHFK